MKIKVIETGLDLINLFERKDSNHFALFYNQYFQKLLLLCDKYVQDMPVAEEIVHDVFIKIWANPYKLSEVRSLKSYLYKSTVNASINHIGKQKNIIVYEEHMPEQLTEDELDIIDQENSLIVLLYQEIDRLPEQCRKVFKMSRFELLKYREIAEKLNISERTVENHLRAALKTLRARLTESIKHTDTKPGDVIKFMTLFLY
ncbi:RNA polymerase sigma-70 factor [Pedobacter nototheniae]|uniref:RNA polymerase sigma-70 factor n=1 Tax=Pedobacter nototheniae TaxID=2488994 RepID=UPI001040DA72|nr:MULTISPECIES: RNA polymerase sigma-70 factor [Pedobacter]